MKGWKALATTIGAVILGRLVFTGKGLIEYWKYKQIESLGFSDPEPPVLRSGTDLLFEVDPGVLLEADPSISRDLKAVLRRRLERFEVKDFRIYLAGSHLSVQVSVGPEDPSVKSLRKLIEEQGDVSFHLVAPEEDQTDSRIQEVQEEEARYREARCAWLVQKYGFEGKRAAEGAGEAWFTAPQPRPPELLARPEVYFETPPDGTVASVEKPRNPWGNPLTVLENGEESKIPDTFLDNAELTLDEEHRSAVSLAFDLVILPAEAEHQVDHDVREAVFLVPGEVPAVLEGIFHRLIERPDGVRLRVGDPGLLRRRIRHLRDGLELGP